MAKAPGAWTWGWGEFGRLGLGDTTSHREPTALEHEELQGAIMIACGGHHTVAVTEAGRVVTWGWGNDGQLGSGNTHDQMQPTEVKALATQRIAAVACGYYHTSVVTEDGVVMCWGKGNSGQLGLGDAATSLVPRPVAALQQHTIRDVSCGAAHTLALSDGGVVFAWGSGADGQLGVGERTEEQPDAHGPVQVQGIDGRITSIAAGSRHSLCISLEDSRLYAWGNNGDGRLGFEDGRPRFLPATPPPFHQAGMRVSGIAGGGHHSAVIEENGQLWTCGKGSYGQLGHGDTSSSPFLHKVEALRGHSVAKIACGDTHSIALSWAGDVWVWGAGEDGQLGLPDDCCQSRCCLPRKLAVLRRAVSDVAAGLVHSAAIAPVETHAVQAKVNELQGQVQGLTAQLRHAQASALAHQRERLQAEHRLQQAERQIEKLTNLLGASTHATQSASAELRSSTRVVKSGKMGIDIVELDSPLAAPGAPRLVEVAVQTEGVLLLPTALRAHGARVQQQLARRAGTHEQLSRPMSSAAFGERGQADASGACDEAQAAGGAQASAQGLVPTQDAAVGELQRRCKLLQRIKAHRADAVAPAGAATAGSGAAGQENGEQDEVNESFKTFFDDVPCGSPTKVSAAGDGGSDRGWLAGVGRRGAGGVGSAADDGQVLTANVACDAALHGDDDLLLEQELDLDLDEGSDEAFMPGWGGVSANGDDGGDESIAQDLFYLPSAIASRDACAAPDTEGQSDEQVLAAALRLAKKRDKKSVRSESRELGRMCGSRERGLLAPAPQSSRYAASLASEQLADQPASTSATFSSAHQSEPLAGDVSNDAPGPVVASPISMPEGRGVHGVEGGRGGRGGGCASSGASSSGNATPVLDPLAAGGDAVSGHGGVGARGRGRGMMSKVKKGITGFLFELKEELLTDRPDDGP